MLSQIGKTRTATTALKQLISRRGYASAKGSSSGPGAPSAGSSAAYTFSDGQPVLGPDAPRPEIFVQRVALTDGSTITLRTTSPRPSYKLSKDTRNHPLWNPHLGHGVMLENVQLSRFTQRFAGFVEEAQTKTTPASGDAAAAESATAAATGKDAAGEINIADTLDDYNFDFDSLYVESAAKKKAKGKPTPSSSGKGGKKKK
ncbi:hypothetical protein GQ42DRAFT_165692 [Ramicandelaber brevisporus]|nr:hypothetical protein GQ42DRAFT_165692 [Ramicandelaber brevisporus]